MRPLALFFVAALVAGCAHQEYERTATNQKAPSSRPTKPPSRSTNAPTSTPPPPLTYACRPEPVGGCNGIREANACHSELRCQWVREHEKATGAKVPGYCRNIHCRDS